MKISKFKFLKFLAKHLSIKLNTPTMSEADLVMLATSLAPIFTPQLVQMKKAGLIDDRDFIDIDLLEKKTTEFFSMVPVVNFPFGETTLSITKQDADKFIKDLFAAGDLEEIIYLPCQN